jgi:TolB protein
MLKPLLQKNTKRFMTLNYLQLLYVLLAMNVLCLNIAQARSNGELVIEITSGVDVKTRIGVVPFQNTGVEILPEQIDQIVSFDLYRSGLFTPLSADKMISRPARPEDVVYNEWQAVNLDYLVVGKLKPLGNGSYQFEFDLLNVLNKQSVLRLSGQGSNLRDIAHYISDQLYEKLIGVPGAFSTQILYVTLERDITNRPLYRLRRADSDGYRAVTLFESNEPILSPSWSPSATKVAYVSYHHKNKPAIYLQDIATGKQIRLTQFTGLNGAPDWSPDGRSMVMTLSKDGNPEIYKLDITTGQLQRLTDQSGIDTEARWMPDGKSIVFTSDRGGSPQIYQLSLADKSVKRLTFQGDYNARAAITADGRYLAMVHRHRSNFNIAVQDLWYNTFKVVTKTDLDESPSIAPNGSMLIYSTRDQGQEMLQLVSLDGQVKVRLPARSGTVREPAWSPFLRKNVQ